MSDTYIGWDGKQYPWPPPEGWYQAIDGRYWAPGTGPNPPPQGAGTQTTVAPPPATAFPPPTQNLDSSQTSQIPVQGASAAAAQTAAAPHDSPTAGFSSPAFSEQTASRPPSESQPVNSPATVNYGFSDGPPVNPGGNVPLEPVKKGGGLLQAALIVFGMIAVALIGGLGYFYFNSDSGSDTATQDDAGSTTTIESSVDPTDNPADTTDTTLDGGSATTGADTTALGSSPDLSTFRSILEENGLASANLTDDSIMSFADSFCGMAVDATDAEEFAVTRETSVASTESNLSDDELRLVIDAALISFCPTEATRLNVEL